MYDWIDVCTSGSLRRAKVMMINCSFGGRSLHEAVIGLGSRRRSAGGSEAAALFGMEEGMSIKRPVRGWVSSETESR